MSGILNCCAPCNTNETVSIPGTEGDPGDDGINGVDAFTHVRSAFQIPAMGLNVTISVDMAVWMVVGQVLIIGEGIIPSAAPNGWAHFQVIAIIDSNTVTVKSLDYTGDTIPGQFLASGATVSPAGMVGPAGP